MIVYAVAETRANYEKQNPHSIKRKLESVGGQPCLVMHYADLCREQLHAWGVQAVVISGYGTALDQRPPENFTGIYDLARSGEIPMLGFCGGHQMLAELWATHNDGGITRMSTPYMRDLRPDEADVHAEYNPGKFKEWGFHPIHIVKADPLFEGLPSPFMANEKHAREVKELSPALELLASTEACRIQAFRHRSKPVYGTQFHCEAWIDHYPHGRTVIENFFRIAGIL